MKATLSVAIISLVMSVAAPAREPLVQVEPPAPVDPWLGYALGVQYESSDMDLTLDGTDKNFDIQAVYGVLSVPLSQRWDFMLRLGGANASARGFDGKTDWSWGMGLHAIIASWDELALEAKGQLTSITSSKKVTVTVLDNDNDPNSFRGTQELSLFEYNLMVGPTWSHGSLSLSGGAMLRYMTGNYDLTVSGGGSELDVDHKLRIGGYVGAGFDVTQNIGVFGNVQLDEQLTRFSAGLLWKL